VVEIVDSRGGRGRRGREEEQLRIMPDGIVVYRVYKERWSGLAGLMLMNIVVSWGVRLLVFVISWVRGRWIADRGL